MNRRFTIVVIISELKPEKQKLAEDLNTSQRIMKWPSNNALIGVAGFLGMGIGCSGLYMHNKIQKNFKQTVFVRESLRRLRTHEPSKYLLGEREANLDNNLASDFLYCRYSYQGSQHRVYRHREQFS